MVEFIHVLCWNWSLNNSSLSLFSIPFILAMIHWLSKWLNRPGTLPPQNLCSSNFLSYLSSFILWATQEAICVRLSGCRKEEGFIHQLGSAIHQRITPLGIAVLSPTTDHRDPSHPLRPRSKTTSPQGLHQSPWQRLTFTETPLHCVYISLQTFPRHNWCNCPFYSITSLKTRTMILISVPLKSAGTVHVYGKDSLDE